MIAPELLAVGVAFYDIQRGYGATDYGARQQAVTYMRRKADEPGDAMPYFEALAGALAVRASARIAEVQS